MWWIKRNKHNELVKWHKWFAWCPVVVSKTSDGDSKVVWLCNVLRCGTFSCGWGDCYWEWEYKEIVIKPIS